MQIQKNVSLADFSTMRLGGIADELCEITSESELTEALTYAAQNDLQIHMIGSGSNTIFGPNGFNGLIVINKITGIDITERETEIEITVGAGENWDSVVELSVKKGYADIAALSLIPGTTGAAPVQNIGAYGQQISDSILAVRVYDIQLGKFVIIGTEDCGFSYRHSRFNTTDKNRFIITSVKMRLYRKNIMPPFYPDLEKYFTNHDIDMNIVTPAQLREAVSTVRVVKLPDPSTVANCGSFFKNPIVTPEIFNTLTAKFPELKSHVTDDENLKLYGAQLIEMCGMKDFHDDETGMATWKNQALVLVNEHAADAGDLLVFKQKVIDAVYEKFGIMLVQEPEFIES